MRIRRPTISKNTNGYKIAVIIVIAFLGIAIGVLIPKPSSTVKIVRDPEAGLRFVSPMLLIQVSESDNIPDYKYLKDKINSYILSKEKDKKASIVSVYFRDLNSSHWIGVNSNEKYSPASMMKVLILLTILRMSEKEPAILSKGVLIKSLPKNTYDQDYYKPEHPVLSGEVYTVNDLLSHMIIESDNNATYALIDVAGQAEISKTYEDLSIPQTDDGDNITTQQYSHAFRVMFSATYLQQRSLSDQALNLLSRTNFKDGIIAGVPKETVISHKFGERTLAQSSTSTSNNSPTKELHDCGIVYYPDHPYFICIMTKGNDFNSLANIISDISSLICKNVPNLN